MSPETAQAKTPKLWKPHPDDAANLRDAMACADRREFLSPAATEAFLKWMEGAGDDSCPSAFLRA